MDRLALNQEEIEKRRAERWNRVSLREIPLLRVIGFAFLSFGVFLNNRYLLHFDSNVPWLETTAILALYSAVSWALTIAFYQRTPVDVTILFLAVDMVVWTLVIYQTGGEKSWLFFILLMRVADQAQTNYRRFMAFVALGYPYVEG